jgi:hypothetical protein
MDNTTDLTFKTWVNAFVFTDTTKMLLKRGWRLRVPSENAKDQKVLEVFGTRNLMLS